MFNKFALSILDEVAGSCENIMNTPETPEVVSEIYNKVSFLLTEAILDISEKSE